MGVDFEILQGVGYCIRITDLSDAQRKYLDDNFYNISENKLSTSPIEIYYQNCYGNESKDAQVFILLSETKRLISSYRIGWTPFNFLKDQIYRGNPNSVRGGGQKYFAISTNSNYETNDIDETLSSILPPCEECIKYEYNKISNQQCVCRKDDVHYSGNIKMVKYKEDFDKIFKGTVIESMCENRSNFSQWLFSYYN
jgi:hypothetical protein